MERIQIETFDSAHANEQLLLSVSDLYSQVEYEVRPDLTPPPADEYVARLQNLSKYRAALRWVVLSQNGEVIGCSYLGFKRVSENPTAARIDILVSQPHRRQKVGTALLAPLIEAADTNDRKDFTCTAREDSSGASFLKSIGARHRGQSIESLLYITEVQELQLRRVLDSYNRLSEQYQFFWWENSCPERLIVDLAYAKMWLNTVPRSSRREENWLITPEWIREEEVVRLNSSISWWTMAAIEKETKRIAAFTDVLFSFYRPWLAAQQDTAVDPKHRGRGLAIFLKANLILKIRNELPNIRVLTATNGSSNGSILHINQKLGFIPKYQFGKWEVDLEQLQSYYRSALL